MKILQILLCSFFVATASASTFDEFLHAIATVESSGNPKAHNKKEDARGLYQIRAIYVKDCQRLSPKSNFTHDDAYDPDRAKQMVKVYLSHYAKVDLDKPLTMDMMEKMARIHNGGPSGHKKSTTIQYWEKVKNDLHQTK